MRIVGIHREDPSRGCARASAARKPVSSAPCRPRFCVVTHDLDAACRAVALLGRLRGAVLAAVVHDDDAHAIR